MKKVFDWLLNVVIVGLLLFVLFRQDGFIRGPVSEWLEQRATLRTIAEEWDALAGGDARLGSDGEDAVVLVEFSDFQCPFCAMAAVRMESFLALHPEVAVVYRHFPLRELHPKAEEAALAAICATEQEAFPEMYRFLFEDETWDSDGSVDWAGVVQTVRQPDPTRLVDCMSSPSARARLDEDLELAHRLGLNSTPTFVGPNGIVSGLTSHEELERILGLPGPGA